MTVVAKARGSPEKVRSGALVARDGADNMGLIGESGAVMALRLVLRQQSVLN
jgi:hypothetical protein